MKLFEKSYARGNVLSHVSIFCEDGMVALREY